MNKSQEKIELSEAGRARKERMLGELEAAMARRVRQRRVVRAAGSVGVCALAGVVVWGAVWGVVAWNRPAANRGVPAVVKHEVIAPREMVTAPSTRRVVEIAAPVMLDGARRLAHVEVVEPVKVASFVVVERGEGDIGRFVVEHTPSLAVKEMTDDELMAALATTGNEYGLMRVGRKVRVECYSCDGKEIGG